MKRSTLVWVALLSFLPAMVVWGQDSSHVRKVSSIPEETGEVLGVAFFEDYALIAIGAGGLRVVEISNPAHPRDSRMYPNVVAYRIHINGDYGYLADNLGLSIYDITEPNSLQYVGAIRKFGAGLYNETVVENFVYLALWSRGLGIVDLANPTPIIFEEFNYATNVYVSENNAFITSSRGVYIADISNPVEPRQIGRINTLGPGHPKEIVVRNNFAFMIEGESVDYNYGQLTIVDISDLEHPRSIRPLGYRGIATNVALAGNYLVVGYQTENESGRLIVVDVSNPEEPIITGYSDEPRHIFDIVVGPSNLIYVAQHTNLDIYDCSEAMGIASDLSPHPSSFILYPAYPNPFNSAVTARFALPAPGMVRLDVFDAMGRLVGILTDRNVCLTGEHKVVWDANGIPSGNYLLQMQAQGYQETQIISLIR